MKKKLIVVLCLVMVFTMAFAGCGQKEDATSNTPVVEKTSLTVAMTTDFDSTDPQVANNSHTDRIMYNVYEGLFKPSVDGNLEPALAKDYTFDAATCTFTFNLRQGVKFHDGSDFSAKDVVYSVKRLSGMLPEDQTAVKGGWQSSVVSVEAVDDYTVKLVLNSPNASFVGNLIQYIVPENAGGTLTTTPNGTGPYKLASYEPGVGCVLEKNENYWGTPANIDVVNVKMFSDSSASLLAMQNGEVDFLEVTKSKLELVPDTYQSDMVSTCCAWVVNLDCEGKVFGNKELRQALNYATNKDKFVADHNPGAEIIDGPITATQKFWQNPAIKGAYKYDLAKANELLAKNGYTADKKCHFVLIYAADLDPYATESALALQAMWNEANFDCELKNVQWSAFTGTGADSIYYNTERDYDAAIFGYTGKLDPAKTFDRWISTDLKNNCFELRSEAYDAAAKAAQVELDQAKRQQLYYTCQQILSDEAVGVWLQDIYSYVTLKKGLTGYVQYPVYFWNFALMKWN